MFSPVSTLRELRHGALKPLDPLWVQLGRVYQWLLRISPGEGTTLQRIGPYGPFKMTATFRFSDFAHWGGGHNRGFAACIEACRDKTCVLDIGAHIGLVTLPASQALATDGRLYAFEPAEANLRHLYAHLSKNGVENVEVVQYLVGPDDRESVPFFEQAEPAGVNSILRGKNSSSFRQTDRPQCSLDRFCAARGLKPEVIKIDVEGGEIGVLEGGRRVLERHRPLIFLSAHPAHLSALGHGDDDLARVIDELGYDAYDMDGKRVERFRLDEYRLVAREAAREPAQANAD